MRAHVGVHGGEGGGDDAHTGGGDGVHTSQGCGDHGCRLGPISLGGVKEVEAILARTLRYGVNSQSVLVVLRSPGNGSDAHVLWPR